MSELLDEDTFSHARQLAHMLRTGHAHIELKTVIVAETEIELIVKERYSAKLCVLLMLKKA
jgi:hypothetical protein